MSDLKYCQGTNCHTYTTQDRLKGTKPNKTYQTRRRSNLLWDLFCDTRCAYDWIATYGTRAVDHFGRTTDAKHLREHNAWVKDYDWRANADDSHRYYSLNKITREQRPITEQQYEDSNYTLNIS